MKPKKLISVFIITVILISSLLMLRNNVYAAYNVTITYNGQEVNSFCGVPAKYEKDLNFGGSYPCNEYVSRFYRTIYGVTISNMFLNATPIVNGQYNAVQVWSPQPGDIGYQTYNGGPHWMIVKSVSGNIVTVIEQNWKWGDGYGNIITTVDRQLTTSELKFFRASSSQKPAGERFVPDGSKQDIGSDFIAYITPKSNSKLAIQTAGTGNGANVNLTARNENSQIQKWYFKRQSDGSYSIKNMYSGNYLDIEGSGNADHENVQVWSGGSGDKQCWFVYSYNGGYRLVPRSSKEDLKALDIGDDIKAGANLQIYQAVSNNNEWQTFRIIKDAGEKQDIGNEFTATITPKSNSKLALETIGIDNGSNVELGTRNDTEAQKWYFKRQPDGSYSIKNQKAGKYLDIYNTGDTDGENVQVWSGGSGDKQCWFIYSYNGGYRLVPRSSKDDLKALDIGGVGIKDGGNLQIHYYVSDNNAWQTFEIIKDYELGDINQDGKINARDAKLVLQYFNGQTTLTAEQQARADVNKDGKINARDAKLILQKFNGNNSAF